EIHWLPLSDALTRCEGRLVDAIIVDLDSANANIDALRDCVVQNRVPVILVSRGARGEPIARNVGGVFLARPSRGRDNGSNAAPLMPETVGTLVLLNAMRAARRQEPDPPTTEVRSTGRGMILVVDDDEPIRSCLRELLEVEGYTVDVASDGTEALQKLQAG